MSFKPLSSLRRGFGVLWRALDATRRTVLNLLFLIVLIVAAVGDLRRRRASRWRRRPRWCSN